jgi:hypothetical protein
MGSSDLDEAIGRMREAIDRLETAIDIRRRHDARRADADEEFTIMQDDRARLAVELDGALAENRALGAANAAVASVIARAAATIEDLLGRCEDSGGSPHLTP